jgi:hypothetical protein
MEPALFLTIASADSAQLTHDECYRDISTVTPLRGEHPSCYRFRSSAMMKKQARFPRAVDPARVGKYRGSCHAGGGFVWDAVLEHRVWCHPERGAPDKADGSDYYRAFASYPAALRFSRESRGAEKPLALILQKEYIVEPNPGQYAHVKKRRITEWPVAFLSRPQRAENTIPDFLSPRAPRNRLAILRGLARKRG